MQEITIRLNEIMHEDTRQGADWFRNKAHKKLVRAIKLSDNVFSVGRRKNIKYVSVVRQRTLIAPQILIVGLARDGQDHSGASRSVHGSCMGRGRESRIFKASPASRDRAS